MGVDASSRIPDVRHIGALWIGLLLPPIAVLADLTIAYALVPRACATRNTLPIHLAHAGGLLLVLGGGLAAWRTWRMLGGGWPESEGGREARSRFLAGMGVLFSGLCGLLVLAFWIAVLLLDPCQ